MEINVADLEGEKRRDLLRRIVCHERGNLRKDFSTGNLDVLNYNNNNNTFIFVDINVTSRATITALNYSRQSRWIEIGEGGCCDK